MSIEDSSRKLSYLLRHDCNYCYEADGWRLVSDLVDNHSFSLEEIGQIVHHDTKGRFELNDDKSKVRALYGHSVKVDLALSNDTPPEFLYHGTAVKYISSIENLGLLPRSRQYVHLTDNIEMAVRTGLRHGEPVILKISSLMMSRDGFLFHHLNNGVWLTKEVPIKYLEIIIQNNDDYTSF